MSLHFCFIKLELDLAAISFWTVIALGTILLVLSSGNFDDDDDQDGGGTMSPVYEPVYIGSPA